MTTLLRPSLFRNAPRPSPTPAPAPAPAPAPVVEELVYDHDGEPPLAIWLHRQAAALASRNDPRCHWLAGKIAEMETLAHFLGASSPEEYDDRADALERDRADRLQYAEL